MNNIKQILTESFHRELTPEEKTALEKALQNDESLRKEKELLEKTKQTLETYSPAFKENFSGKILENLFGEGITTQIVDFYPVFKKVMLGGIAAVIALLISIYLTDGSFNTDALLGLSDLNSDEVIMALLNF